MNIGIHNVKSTTVSDVIESKGSHWQTIVFRTENGEPVRITLFLDDDIFVIQPSAVQEEDYSE